MCNKRLLSLKHKCFPREFCAWNEETVNFDIEDIYVYIYVCAYVYIYL